MDLNLPKYDVRMERRGGRLFIHDRLRDKFVALTPEEWVRQHFVNYLVECLGYRAALMANEVSIALNGTSRRCDTVVYRRDLTPLMVVECKAPHVALTQRVVDQIARYNLVVGARYLVITNGIHHYCCEVQGASCRFLSGIPRCGALQG